MKRFTKPQRLQVGTSDVVWEAAIFHLPWINSPTRARVPLLWYFMCCDPSSSVDLLTSQHLNEADAEKERSQKRRMSSYVSVCTSLFIYYTDVVLITRLLLPVITYCCLYTVQESNISLSKCDTKGQAESGRFTSVVTGLCVKCRTQTQTPGDRYHNQK